MTKELGGIYTLKFKRCQHICP